MDDYALTNVNFEDSVITTAMISDSTIDLANVTSGMSGVEIKDGDLSAAKFSADIPGDKFKTAEITANSVQTSTISAVKYASNIPRSKIADNVVGTDEFSSFTFSDNTSSAANGTIDWNRSEGDSGDEYARGASNDGTNFLVFGRTGSSSISASTTNDAYLIKYSSDGTLEWESAYGGTGNNDVFRDMVKSSNDYVLVGRSDSSNSGSITSVNNGANDLMLIKVNSSGVKQWDRLYGGSLDDQAFGIEVVTSGGFIIAGYSASSEGTYIETNLGNEDAWLVKTKANGDFLWSKNFGGSADDRFVSVLNTIDNGFLAAGRTASSIDNNAGLLDLYLVKTNSVGELEWEKTIGGTQDDLFTKMIKTSDEGFLAVGYSKSDDGAIGSNAGDEDAIAFKLDSEGETIWSTVIGGSGIEEARDVIELADGSYLIGILSESSQSGDFSSGSKGNFDYWIFKYSADGEQVWSKNYGGDKLDKLRAMAVNSEGTVLAAGNSKSSNNEDVTASNSGETDIWSFTLKPDSKIALDSINSGDFIDNTIATDRIEDQAITAAAINNNALGADEIDGIVDDSKIADEAIDGDKLYDGDDPSKLLSETNLADNSIETSKVGAVITKSMLDSSSTEFQKVFDLGVNDNETHADGLHFHKRGNESCPTGYNDLGGLGFCIRTEDLQKTPKDALNSTQSCQDDGEIHARVCTFQEYTTACYKNQSSLNLTNNGNYLFAGYSSSKALGFIYDGNCNLHSNPNAYPYSSSSAVNVRCCITK